jgi:hypothetical protein
MATIEDDNLQNKIKPRACCHPLTNGKKENIIQELKEKKRGTKEKMGKIRRKRE